MDAGQCWQWRNGSLTSFASTSAGLKPNLRVCIDGGFRDNCHGALAFAVYSVDAATRGHCVHTPMWLAAQPVSG
eukprot:586885-Karenia_brevis.AAC.1